MQLYDHLCAHKSIRNFKDTPIPEGDVEKILIAATRASTSGNIQPYSIIITKDANNRAELVRIALPSGYDLASSTVVDILHRLEPYDKMVRAK